MRFKECVNEEKSKAKELGYTFDAKDYWKDKQGKAYRYNFQSKEFGTSKPEIESEPDDQKWPYYKAKWKNVK